MHVPPPRPKVRQIVLIADRNNHPRSTHQLGWEATPRGHPSRNPGGTEAWGAKRILGFAILQQDTDPH